MHETPMHLARRGRSRQWSIFLSELLGELEVRVEDPALLDKLLRRVGARLAGALPLPGVTTLEDMETGLNKVLTEIEWGWVTITERPRFLVLTHGAFPIFADPTEPPSWQVPVLESAYSEWLRILGGDPALSVRSVEIPANAIEPLRFHYGRHG